jgi:peptidoglycan/xylan/chitin deacetylase (PgdA/CDA1 family)
MVGRTPPSAARDAPAPPDDGGWRGRRLCGVGADPHRRLPARSPGVQIERMRSGVIALMYHGVGEPADPAEGARYTVSVAEFEAQLEQIAAAGGAMDPRRAATGDSGVVLTFDDGERSVLTEALPRLQRRGWVGALFVTTAWLGRPGYLTPAAVRALRRAGWVVGSHGDTHRFLTELPPEALRAELSRSRDRLARLLGDPPAHLSFPGGRTSPRVEDEARAHGFTTLWSSAGGVNAAMLPSGPLRRTAVRRGDPAWRFARLVRGDPLAHAADRLDGAVRAAVRRALGDARYQAVTGRVLAAFGRR